jgi:hypothetical protein
MVTGTQPRKSWVWTRTKRIDPCNVFTSDGKQLLTGKSVGPLSMKWGGKERNAAILRHIVF